MASGVSVTVGVDTHADAHVGVALDQVGRRLGEVAVSNDEDGYRRLLRWARSFGEVGLRWGRRDRKLRCGALTLSEIRRRVGDRGRSPESSAPPEAR